MGTLEVPRVQWAVSYPAIALGSALVLGAAVAINPVLGTAAALALTATIATVRWPIAGVAALVLFLPFNALISQLLGGETLLAQLVGAFKEVVLLGLTLSAFGRRSSGRPLTLVSGAVVCLLAIAVSSALYAPDMVQALYGLRNDFLPIVLVVLIPILLAREASGIVFALVVGIGQVSAVVAIGTWSLGVEWLTRLNIPGLDLTLRFPSAYFSSDAVSPRAFSPYVGPNELGMACLLAATVAFVCPYWKPRWRVGLAVLPIIALSLSRSRSALIGLGIVLVVVIAASRAPYLGHRLRGARAWWAAALFIAIAGAVILANPTILRADDSSAVGHVTSLVDTAGLAFGHPFGFGLGTVGPRAIRFSDSPILTESFLGVVALESGLLALLAYLTVVLSAAALFASRARTHQHGDVAFMGLLAILATSVNQLVLPSLQEGPVSWLLWIVVGTALAASGGLDGRQPFESEGGSGATPRDAPAPSTRRLSPR